MHVEFLVDPCSSTRWIQVNSGGGTCHCLVGVDIVGGVVTTEFPVNDPFVDVVTGVVIVVI